MWLGGVMVLVNGTNQTDMEWAWMDGSKWDYWNWAKGKPINHPGGWDDCAMMVLVPPEMNDIGKWENFHCDGSDPNYEVTNYICKMPVQRRNAAAFIRPTLHIYWLSCLIISLLSSFVRNIL
jgi:hypothetical protein